MSLSPFACCVFHVLIILFNQPYLHFIYGADPMFLCNSLLISMQIIVFIYKPYQLKSHGLSPFSIYIKLTRWQLVCILFIVIDSSEVTQRILGRACLAVDFYMIVPMQALITYFCT